MSEIKLEINASSGADLREQLKQLLGALGGETIAHSYQGPAKEVNLTPEILPATEDPKPETKKPERTPRTSKTETPKPETKAPVNSNDPFSKTEDFSEADLRAIVQAAGPKNAPNVRAIVEEMLGAGKKIGNLSAAEHFDFVTKVKALDGFINPNA